MTGGGGKVVIRIVVISDTHIPRKAKRIPVQVEKAICASDMVIHAGDINEEGVLDILKGMAPLEAVSGNTDSERLKGMLGKRKVLYIEGCKIGLVHGDGVSGTTLGRVKAAFKDDGVDCAVFGHSHIPMNASDNGVLYFNPGSPTDKRRQQQFSYGILEISEGKVSGEIVCFK